jgi:lipopolysaccharide transport system permease protein
MSISVATPNAEAGEIATDAPPSLSMPGAHYDIVAGLGWRNRLAHASVDLRDGARLWRLIWTLSVLDIRLRYRGSMLGPFWLTLSTSVMVGALGFLYSRLFHTDIHTYLPFLSLSLVLWNFISILVSEGCTAFTQSEVMIRSMRMPLTIHAGRVVVRNVLVLAHNIIVIVAVFAIMDAWPGIKAFLAIPGFALWLVDGLAACLLLGAFCARFRDVPPIVASVMQIAFFVSPILWSPSVLAHRGLGIVLLNWNPFYALLEIVRGPMLGTIPSTETYLCAAGYSVGLIFFAGLVFVRTRARISFWV